MIELLIALAIGVVAIAVLLVGFAAAVLFWIEAGEYLERRRRRR